MRLNPSRLAAKRPRSVRPSRSETVALNLCWVVAAMWVAVAYVQLSGPPVMQPVLQLVRGVAG